ncbi:MAG: tannase, partial [Clostridia bacterium]
MIKTILSVIMAAIMFAGCGEDVEKQIDEQERVSMIETNLSQIDNTKWQYNTEDGVYWQVGIQYCENPVSEEFETMGIFVPEAYMSAEDNGDGTFTCAIDEKGSVGGYTAADAPMVIPVNTPGYMS